MAEAKSKRSKRVSSIYATTAHELSRIEVTYNTDTGHISFDEPVVDVRSVLSYQRRKGPKIIASISSEEEHHAFDVDDALQTYDRVFAVDTNTRVVAGRQISVTAVVAATQIFLASSSGGVQAAIRHEVPFCFDFGGGFSTPEIIGWSIFLSRLVRAEEYRSSARIGMLVDAEITALKYLNRRQRPLFGMAFLPPGVTLLYATSDKSDSIANKLMKLADRAASTIFGKFQGDELKPHAGNVLCNPIRGYRTIVNNVR